MKARRLWAAFAAFAALAAPAFAADPYPTRPITILTPFAAGSVTDAAARLTAAEERARGAQSRLRDAELWLRRIHGAIDVRTDAEPGSVDRTAPDDAASAVRDFLMPAAAETARSAAQ